MTHGFDTDDEAAAVAALLVYASWRSRDRSVLKVTPDLWSQIERFVKAAAKRADSLPRFIEAFRPRIGCGALDPRHLASDLAAEPARLVRRDLDTGALRDVIELADPQRPFLTALLRETAAEPVLSRLYRQTGWVVLLVRERLERERPFERAGLAAGQEEIALGEADDADP